MTTSAAHEIANHGGIGERPVHCHDLGDWLSCYGWDTVPTPNIQALAETCVVFAKAFATSPLSTPARSSLFTGRSPHEAVGRIVTALRAASGGPGRREDMVSYLDIVPTLLELTGPPVPAALEGTSILGQIMSTAGGEPDRELRFEKTFHDRYGPIRVVRTRSAKYIRHLADGPMLPLATDLEQSATRAGMGDAHLAPRPAEELCPLERDPWERDIASSASNAAA